MKRYGLVSLALVGALMATAADAGPKGQHGHSGKGHSKHANLGGLFCPPGLAKKGNGCLPPGQAKKLATALPVYQTGDMLPEDYVILVNPQIYNPNLDAVYVRYGDYLYLIDRTTAEVLDRIGLASEWTWDWMAYDVNEDPVVGDTINCPPGLAKKDPPCVPPGLADKGVTMGSEMLYGDIDPYGIGDTLPDGYIVAIDPSLYTAHDNAYYVREGDTIYRADATTGQVLDPVSDVGKLIE